VLHCYDDISAARNEVHRTTHSLYHLAWDDPVCEVPLLRYLETSQD
jgi:hypothetical protein